MRLATVKRILYEFILNHFLVGGRAFEMKAAMLRSIGHEIGADTKIIGPLYCTGHLVIGNNCWIGRNLTVHGNGTVEIGDNCDIAPDVTFLSGGHSVGRSSKRAGKGEAYRICVGRGTWIGGRATLLGNTSVGEGCVVAACACVSRSLPENVLAGGVPAKIIKELEK